jgi:hypothetical protein
VRRIVLPALLVALLAGCGGGGGSADYTLAKTGDCLRAQGVRLDSKLDFVASTATGGAVRAHLADNFVTIAFGQTQQDSEAIAAAYRRFRAKNVGIDDVLRTDRNAVLLWHLHPSDADASAIGTCLK